MRSSVLESPGRERPDNEEALRLDIGDAAREYSYQCCATTGGWTVGKFGQG